MTYYEILQVTETASDEVIRMAYKALAKKYHPDTFEGDKAFADDMMKKINQAYETLSDPAKREEYDALLHLNIADEHKAKFEQKTNSSKKILRLCTSLIIIIGLLFVVFSQVVHPYIISSEDFFYDNAIIFGLRDFSLMCLLLSTIPFLIVFVRNDFSMKNIRIICGVNSIVAFIVSLLLYTCGITSTMSIGWVVALLYYFINSLSLRQFCYYSSVKSKKVTRITIGAIVAILLVIFIVGMAYTSSFFDEKYAEDNNVVSGQFESDTYCVGVRTITLSDKHTANSVIELWEQRGATEEVIICLMDEYGETQGGGKLYIVNRGDWVNEVDLWCFDSNRKVGDVAIIENDYGYTICYFSSIVKKQN